MRSRLRVPLRRERIELTDGDFLDLDWVQNGHREGLGDGAPLVLLLHGLEGSANSGYARQTYIELSAQGLQPVGLNFRGCSGEPNRLPRAYHSGETGDLAHVVGILKERFPGRALGAVGVSLGGNVLLKYLGEIGGEWRNGISAAAAISVPFDLSAGADYIERGFSKTYRLFLLRKLQRKVRQKQSIIRDVVDYEGALNARGFREFDQAVIVPIHGFEDAEDYYRKSSSRHFLTGIGVPTLLIHSLDDPFLPSDRVPEEVTQLNPNVHTQFTRYGGHVGFISGSPLAPVFWAERRAAQFLANELRGAD